MRKGEFGKCARCGFPLDDKWTNGGYWSGDVSNLGINGGYCSGKQGVVLKIQPNDLHSGNRLNDKYRHILVTKEDVIRKLLDKIDKL